MKRNSNHYHGLSYFITTNIFKENKTKNMHCFTNIELQKQKFNEQLPKYVHPYYILNTYCKKQTNGNERKL